MPSINCGGRAGASEFFPAITRMWSRRSGGSWALPAEDAIGGMSPEDKLAAVARMYPAHAGVPMTSGTRPASPQAGAPGPRAGHIPSSWWAMA